MLQYEMYFLTGAIFTVAHRSDSREQITEQFQVRFRPMSSQPIFSGFMCLEMLRFFLPFGLEYRLSS
jgi:uncharacterized membrane protein